MKLFSKVQLALCTVALLSGCDAMTALDSSQTPIAGTNVDREVKSLNKPDAAEEFVEAGGRVECLNERFVIPPRGKDKKAPKFRFAERFKDLVDPNSLGVALNEKDVNFSFDSESGAISFTNPGKSRAVIDVSYCVYFDDNPDGETNSGGGETTSGSDDGMNEGSTTSGSTTSGDTTSGGNTTAGDGEVTSDGSTTAGSDNTAGDGGGIPTDDIRYTGGIIVD